MSQLDFRKERELSLSDSRVLNEISEKVLDEYNNYIESLMVENNLHGVYLLNQVSCRNTYRSSLYLKMCLLSLLIYKLDKGDKISEILIDEESFLSPLNDILSNYNVSTRIKVSRGRMFSLVLFFKRIIVNMYYSLSLWFWVRYFGINKDQSLSSGVVLLDIFFEKNTFANDGKMIDRFYPGLIDNADNDISGKIYYTPVFVGLHYPWDWYRVFKGISGLGSNILLREVYLTFSDYLSSFVRSFTLGRSIKKIPKWDYIDISSIVKSEIFDDLGSFSVTQGLLIHKSFLRLKESNVNIELMIDWFEGQIVDRALCLGMREYYPGVHVKGYIGFVPEDYYAGLRPIKSEIDRGIAPDEVLVIGSEYIRGIRKNFPRLKVSVAPAFRFSSSLVLENDSAESKSIILIALPMIYDEAKKIINFAIKSNIDNSYRWVIKGHPAIPEDVVYGMLPSDMLSRFKITNKPISDLFRHAKLMITSKSSTSLEAVLNGVTVAIVGSTSGPTINPLAGIVANGYWFECYTPDDIVNAVNHDFPAQELDSSKYFMPVNREAVSRMLSCS